MNAKIVISISVIITIVIVVFSLTQIEKEGNYKVEVDYEGCVNSSEEKEVDLKLIDVEAGKDQTIMWDEVGTLLAEVETTNDYTVKWKGDNNQIFTEEEITISLEIFAKSIKSLGIKNLPEESNSTNLTPAVNLLIKSLFFFLNRFNEFTFSISSFHSVIG